MEFVPLMLMRSLQEERGSARRGRDVGSEMRKDACSVWEMLSSKCYQAVQMAKPSESEELEFRSLSMSWN